MYHVSYKFRNPSLEKTKKWTESFYIDNIDLATATTKANGLAAVLVPLHGKQSVLTGYRISDPEKVRAGVLLIPGKNAPPISGSTFDADYPSTGLQIQVTGTDGTIVNQSLRGLKDDVIKGGDKVPDPAWDPLFASLKAFIEDEANSVKLWVQDPTADSWILESISEAGVVSMPPFLIGDNKKVIITGRGLPKYFRKVWRIQNINAASLQLRGFKVQNGFVFANMTADLTLDKKHAVKIKSFDYIRATSHKVTKEKN